MSSLNPNLTDALQAQVQLGVVPASSKQYYSSVRGNPPVRECTKIPRTIATTLSLKTRIPGARAPSSHGEATLRLFIAHNLSSAMFTCNSSSRIMYTPHRIYIFCDVMALLTWYPTDASNLVAYFTLKPFEQPLNTMSYLKKGLRVLQILTRMRTSAAARATGDQSSFHILLETCK